jgi:protein-arginine kinase
VHCVADLAAAGIASDWPHGRGCYVSEDKQFVIWVGEEDHLRIMCMFKGTVLNDVFDRLQKVRHCVGC